MISSRRLPAEPARRRGGPPRVRPARRREGRRATRRRKRRDSGPPAQPRDGYMRSGPPLVDMQVGPLLDAEIRRLEESRLTELMQRNDAKLRLALHNELPGELAGLVTEYPTHENLHAQYMLSLYRSGRCSDALLAFRRLREHLVGELGLEPSVKLQRLHGAILSADPGLSRLSSPRSTRSSITSWRPSSYRAPCAGTEGPRPPAGSVRRRPAPVDTVPCRCRVPGPRSRARPELLDRLPARLDVVAVDDDEPPGESLGYRWVSASVVDSYRSPSKRISASGPVGAPGRVCANQPSRKRTWSLEQSVAGEVCRPPPRGRR